MPSRKKSISANFGVAVGPSPATGIHTVNNIKELYGVTSVSYDTSQAKEDVLALGRAAPVDRVAIDPASLTVDITYNQANLDNENSLGLVVNGLSGAFAKIINGQADDRNIFIPRAAEGFDVNGLAGANLEVIGFGNATIASYAFEAAVGSFPTTTIGFQALEGVTYADGSAEVIPAVDPNTGLRATGLFTLPTFSGNPFGRDAVLLPGDVTVDFSNATGWAFVLSGTCVQSVSIDVDFNREADQCLGQKYALNSIQFPIPVNFSADVFAQDLKTGSLSTFLCNNTGSNVVVTVRRPNCTQGAGAIAWQGTLRNLDWDSESLSVPADGSAAITTVNFVGFIGSSNDLSNGLFLSGISNT